MSTSGDRSTGLLTGDSSDSYSVMDGGAEPQSGLVSKLRYRSPHLVLPLLAALLVAIVVIIALLVVDVMKGSSPHDPIPPLHSLIHFEDANTHLNGLQQAADIGNGTRETGTAGYTASLAYIGRVLDTLPALRWRLQSWTEPGPSGMSGVNIIADTITGDAANTVVMGGHLDSHGGPGLNDDGSGSVAVLLLAVAVNDAILSGNLTLVNRIRFHWYDAEEAGLRGSHAAVAMGVNATEVGERVVDWVCQMQADMVNHRYCTHTCLLPPTCSAHTPLCFLS
jgi:hypothetical protein